MKETTNMQPPSNERPKLSIGEILRIQIERLSNGFIAIK
ncbi:hypothetical protein OROGR_027225 [Orobanche gracilis]